LSDGWEQDEEQSRSNGCQRDAAEFHDEFDVQEG
jgi:hypothetical protein